MVYELFYLNIRKIVFFFLSIFKLNPLCTKVGFEKENKITFLLGKQEAIWIFFNLQKWKYV